MESLEQLISSLAGSLKIILEGISVLCILVGLLTTVQLTYVAIVDCLLCFPQTDTSVPSGDHPTLQQLEADGGLPGFYLVISCRYLSLASSFH